MLMMMRKMEFRSRDIPLCIRVLSRKAHDMYGGMIGTQGRTLSAKWHPMFQNCIKSREKSSYRTYENLCGKRMTGGRLLQSSLLSFHSLQESQLPLPSSSSLVCLVFHVNLLPCWFCWFEPIVAFFLLTLLHFAKSPASSVCITLLPPLTFSMISPLH